MRASVHFESVFAGTLVLTDIYYATNLGGKDLYGQSSNKATTTFILYQSIILQSQSSLNYAPVNYVDDIKRTRDVSPTLYLTSQFTAALISR